MGSLTDRQAEIHQYMLEYQRENGIPPSFRDICRRFEFNSPNAAVNHLKAMQKKAFVSKFEARPGGPTGKMHRCWRAIDPARPTACPCCGRESADPAES